MNRDLICYNWLWFIIAVFTPLHLLIISVRRVWRHSSDNCYNLWIHDPQWTWILKWHGITTIRSTYCCCQDNDIGGTWLTVYSIQHITVPADPCNDSICCLASLQIIMNAVIEGTFKVLCNTHHHQRQFNGSGKWLDWRR